MRLVLDNDLIAATDYILNASLSRSQWHDLAAGREKKFPTSGKDVYLENCAVCHDQGVNGAPKIGDKKVWVPLIAQNMDVLIERTMHSDAHPKQGACKLCSTGELIEAIKYMVSRSKPKEIIPCGRFFTISQESSK
jgi:Cytochrome c5